jgi:hypothetical protein
LRGISAATACEIGAGEAPPGKIKHFSSVNPARGKALRPRLGHPLSQERGAVNDLMVGAPLDPCERSQLVRHGVSADGREHHRGVAHCCRAQQRHPRC